MADCELWNAIPQVSIYGKIQSITRRPIFLCEKIIYIYIYTVITLQYRIFPCITIKQTNYTRVSTSFL